MKTNSLMCLMATLAAALFSSCQDDVEMLTVLNRDGSCHRELTLKTDTMQQDPELNHLSTAFLEGGWQKVKEEKLHPEDSASTEMTYTYACDYASVEEMAKGYPLQIAGKPMLKDCKLEKTFRWFYTDYTFTETYNDFSTAFHIPLSKYILDDEAISFLLTGKPNLLEGKSGLAMAGNIETLNKQFDKWGNANLLYDAFEIMAEHYDSIDGLTVPRHELIDRRDELIDYAISNGLSFGDTKSPEVQAILNEFFHTDCFGQVWSEKSYLHENLLVRYKQDYLSLLTLNLGYRLAMPDADIIDCGNGQVKNGAVAYSLTGAHFLSRDFTVTATFRAANTWAYIVTGIIIAMAVACGLNIRKKK